MAIDTRERRQAVVGISHYFIGPNVTPNAAPDLEWRQEVGWGYPGIAVGAPVAPSFPPGSGGFGGGGLLGFSGGGEGDEFFIIKGTKRTAGGLGPRKRKLVKRSHVGGL